MMTLAKVLDVLSSLAVLVGLVWGAVSIKATEHRLNGQKATIVRIRDEVQARPLETQGLPGQSLTERLRAEGVPFSTYDDALTRKQDTELTVVRYLAPALAGPFVLAVVGTVLGVVVAVINVVTR